ncbi:MAG: DUF1302 domain-containing protein [Albidovulum sp.]|nr:DUF1302 domain-containing protein [Albidovulum sp.]
MNNTLGIHHHTSLDTMSALPRTAMENCPGNAKDEEEDLLRISFEKTGVFFSGPERILQTGDGNALPRTNLKAIACQAGFTASAAAMALAGILLATPAAAFEFGNDLFYGSLDTTISHGVTFRVQKADPDLADNFNSNDGNLNYDRGLVSNTSKFTTDLDLSFGNYGAFVRASGYIDFENRLGFRQRNSPVPGVTTGVGSDVEILDAYVTGSFESDGQYMDFRLGRHVLNWGESTFITNGINDINRFDVGKLRLPGSELREALLPVSMISASFSPNELLSFEGFYQLEWKKTEIDPVGSYFSTTDYVGEGARKAVVTQIPGVTDMGFGFGPLTPAINADLDNYKIQHPQLGTVRAPQPRQFEFDSEFATVIRAPDRTARKSGQWGIAARFLAEDFNETEFGFYFMNYHSRLPVVSGITGSLEGIQAGLAAAQAVSAPNSETIRAVTAAVTAEVTTAVTNEVKAAATAQVTEAAKAAIAASGQPIPPEQVQGMIARAVAEQVPAIVAARVPPIVAAEVPPRVRQGAEGIAQAMAVDRFAKTSRYFLEYPEDIKLFGLSFNTVLGASGWALQGEYSQRHDAPLQRAERVVIGEGLAPIGTALHLAANDPAQLQGYLASYRPRTVQGYVKRNVSQIQATATKVFGPMFGADGLVFLTEAAVMHVHDMPDEPLESQAGGTLPDEAADADMNSWGYRVAARLDYLNAIGAVNLYPYTQFAHDVGGNSPAPSGPFIEGRTALTIGIRADYLSRWQADLGYTRYDGDGNALSDRDFVYASVNYSF